MRERVADFRRRVGAAYAPSVRVAGARPLADEESCPTLFRYPGPEALLEALARRPPPLAPPGAGVLWLAEGPLDGAPGPVAAFGTLAVLEPLRLAPAVLDGPPRRFVAAPALVDEERLVWVPPSRVHQPGAAWDAIATAADARAHLGDTDDERAEVLDRLGGYLEELALLAAAGVPPPAGAWIDVAASERRRVLAEKALTGAFTR